MRGLLEEEGGTGSQKVSGDDGPAVAREIGAWGRKGRETRTWRTVVLIVHRCLHPPEAAVLKSPRGKEGPSQTGNPSPPLLSEARADVCGKKIPGSRYRVCAGEPERPRKKMCQCAAGINHFRGI